MALKADHFWVFVLTVSNFRLLCMCSLSPWISLTILFASFQLLFIEVSPHLSFLWENNWDILISGKVIRKYHHIFWLVLWQLYNMHTQKGLTYGFLLEFGNFWIIPVIYFAVCIVPDLTSVLPTSRLLCSCHFWSTSFSHQSISSSSCAFTAHPQLPFLQGACGS